LSSDDATRLESTWRELRAKFNKVEREVCDVRSERAVEQLVGRVLAASNHIDVLVNNAGYATYQTFAESSTREIVDLLDVNLAGAMRCTRAVLPSMMNRGRGSIVNVASIGGEIIITPNAVYCAAKHGMVAWSLAIRYELLRHGIAVSVVCPGYTRTAFHDHPTFGRRAISRSTLRKALTPRRVAKGVLRAALTRRRIVFVPWWHRYVAWLMHAAPWLTLPVWDRLALRRIEWLYRGIERGPVRDPEPARGVHNVGSAEDRST
jgi:short-subunit dehydrogenase